MTTPPNTSTTAGALPAPVRHAMLNRISAKLANCHQAKAVEVFGTWYQLHTIDPSEHAWTLRYTESLGNYAVSISQRAPILARAIAGIGERAEKIEPIALLFTVPEDMDPEAKRLVLSSPVLEKDWRSGEVLRWLIDPEQHQRVIDALWIEYVKLIDLRDAALEALRPLSATTPTGESRATSSPEKASSSPTLPSSG